MGETQNQPFQLSINSSLKVDFQGSRVTSDCGLLLVCELDERLRLSGHHWRCGNGEVLHSSRAICCGGGCGMASMEEG